MLESVIWIVIFLVSIINLAKILSGKSWSCFFVKHKYSYSYIKYGMYIDPENNIVSTSRKVYTCRCEAEKQASEEDTTYT